MVDCGDRLPVIAITVTRRQSLVAMILGILEENSLGPALAAKLYGRLSFATTQMFGRFGRAKLTPLKRRQYEAHRTTMNRQIHHCLRWWLAILDSYVPRQVPVSLQSKGVVISYSDGEGESAGVGVAVWHYSQEVPVAAFLKVPREVRLLWNTAKASQLPSELLSDIFHIEAVGPLIVVNQWPQLVTGELWIHFVDNEGAKACLIRGSSRIDAGDIIMGHTWKHVAQCRALLWVDRVHTHSNPVDGLSRGRFEGPWRRVEQANLPADLLADLRNELF